jgi:hypothetical protein
MNDYRFDLGVLFQEDQPSVQGVLDAVVGFCDAVIRSEPQPHDLDYEASLLIAIIEKMKTWQPMEDNSIHDGLVVLDLQGESMTASIANEDCFTFLFKPGVRVCRLEEQERING